MLSNGLIFTITVPLAPRDRYRSSDIGSIILGTTTRLEPATVRPDDRITTVQFVEHDGKTDVIAYWTDGSFGHLLSYYPDEISFRADDLIGLTEREARELHFTRDKEHLQS